MKLGENYNLKRCCTLIAWRMLRSGCLARDQNLPQSQPHSQGPPWERVENENADFVYLLIQLAIFWEHFSISLGKT